MPQTRPSTDARPSGDSDAPSGLRWFLPAAGVLNILLLMQVVNRFHQASTPINHGLARVLATALIVNVAGVASILWLAVVRQWTIGLSSILKSDIILSLLPFLMASLRQGEKDRTFRLFALVYVIFLLCRMLELLYYAGRNAASTTVRLPVIVFAGAFIVYGGVAPWMALASGPQGDESHLMILTHSLVYDHDFDVGDNYANGDYREQFPPPSPGEMRGYPYAFMQRDGIEYLPHEPHVVRNFRGQMMLEHDPGLPILIAPGYALDKREGALFTIALIGAAGAAAIFEISMALGAGIWPALLTVALFCFTCPYWVFTQGTISDGCGGVSITWVALQFFRYRKLERKRYLVLAGILMAALPWLNIRWWSLAGMAFLVLCAWIIRRHWGDTQALVTQLACVIVPNLAGLAAFVALDKALYNMYVPNASMILLGRVMPQFEFHPVHGFLGMLFDQGYGLVPTAPLYVAVAAGMVALYRRDRWAFAMLFLPVLGYLPFIALSHYWFGGWNAPARYLVSATTLMIPAATLVINRKVRWALAALTAWSFSISILFTVNPWLRIPSLFHLYKLSMLVEYLHDLIHTPMYSILSVFPNLMMARPVDYVRASFWLIVFCVGAWLWSRTAEPQDAERSIRQKTGRLPAAR